MEHAPETPWQTRGFTTRCMAICAMQIPPLFQEYFFDFLSCIYVLCIVLNFFDFLSCIYVLRVILNCIGLNKLVYAQITILMLLLLSTHSSLIIGGSPLLLSFGGSPPASPASYLAGLLTILILYSISWLNAFIMLYFIRKTPS